jgi:hypothetical protein
MNFFRFSPKTLRGLIIALIFWPILEIVFFAGVQATIGAETLPVAIVAVHSVLLFGVPIYFLVGYIYGLIKKRSLS